MRNESQKTMVGIIRESVIAWRKREGWSREAVVQVIVEAHEAFEAPANTGIVFDPTTRDAFERQKVNADRVFRWLDDEGKDTNLLPTNFIHSIWAAMPIDVRVQCVADCVRPVGLTARSSDAAEGDEFDASAQLRELVKTSAEAQLALINVQGGGDLHQLEVAHRQMSGVHEATNRILRAILSAIALMRSGLERVHVLPARRKSA